jgi:AraC-like DNA-binding protein
MVSCRTIDRVLTVLHRELVDAVVIDVRTFGVESALSLVESYSGIPVFALSAFRPDDGALIGACLDKGMRGIFVQGVDDAIVGETLMAKSASRNRRDALASAPRLLRLTEPLQMDAWNAVLENVGQSTTTSDIARKLGRTREYLSREFAAGGAPNLKRVIDLIRAAWAADLLKNPGYTVRTVSEILQFSSPSHLAGCSKRVAGVAAADLANLGPKGVLQRFRRGRTRSRL